MYRSPDNRMILKQISKGDNHYKVSPFRSIWPTNMVAKINSFSIFSANIISLPQEVRGLFVIKAGVEMQNNLRFCD
jgi:hypothetical protein